MHEEPIVCTPDDAIRAFLQGNLDYLAIGGFLVERQGAGLRPKRCASATCERQVSATWSRPR